MRPVTQEQKNIISEIIQMREQYLNEVGIGKRRAWPKSIKTRIVSLFTQKLNRRYLAQATGIPYDTIREWAMEHRDQPMFQSVPISSDYCIVPPPSVDGSQSPIKSTVSGTVTVTTPDGYQVQGSVKEIFRVLNRIRRS